MYYYRRILLLVVKYV